MARVILMSVIMGMVLLGATNYGEACTCGSNYPLPVLEQYDEAAAVFTGVIISVRAHETYTIFNEVKIQVTGVWKGVTSEVVHVLTTMGDGACGIRFSIWLDREFLIYAYDDRVSASGELSTNTCTRTVLIEFAQEDLDVLGDPHTVPAEGTTWGAIKALYDDDSV